jgi:hypothetical protein
VHDLFEPAVGADLDRADRPAELRLVDVEYRADRDAVLTEDRRTGDRLAEPSRTDRSRRIWVALMLV